MKPDFSLSLPTYQVMAGFAICLRFGSVNVPCRECCSSFVASSGPRIRYRAIDPGGSNYERQNDLAEELSWKPVESPDNMLDKTGFWGLDWKKQNEVGSRMDDGMGSWSGRPGEELQSLCENGQVDKALDVLDQQGTTPSGSVYRSLLKGCIRKKSLVQAKRVHAHLLERGMESSIFVGEYVVSTLVKCGGLDDALQVFHRLPEKTTFSWTAVISGYSVAGRGQDALAMYQCMLKDGVEANSYTFVSLLKACGSIGDLEEGKRIHADILRCRLGSDLFVCTSLVDMYAKCGSIVDAQNVFDTLSQRDVVSWNAMLAAYVEQGAVEKALELYEQMHEEGTSPTARTFVSTIQACILLADGEVEDASDGRSIKVKALEIGKAIHADSRKKGHDADAFVGNTLINMYGKCRTIMEARYVFDGLSQQNVVSWTIMLAVYAQDGQGEKALQMYQQMQEEGVSPNERTVMSALQACGILADRQGSKEMCLGKGKAIHAYAQRKGFNCDVFLCNTLISMYGKCGSSLEAQNVFDRLSYHTVVSWNVIIVAYAHQCQAEKVFDMYDQMQEAGVSPDEWTFVTVLQACSMLAEKDESVIADLQSAKVEPLVKGMAIHADACMKGYDLDAFVGNALISMYGRCGDIMGAEIVFNKLSHPDRVSWTAILAAYSQQGQPEKSLRLYEEMREVGVIPDVWTFVTLLQACNMLTEKEEDCGMDDMARAKSLGLGRVIHAEIWRMGCNADVSVCNSLITMYGKYGSIADAQVVFDALSTERDVVSWTGLLGAYAQQGQAEEAFRLYEHMQEEGVSPYIWTFVAVLHALGMLAEDQENVIADGQSINPRHLERGKAIHAAIWRQGFVSDSFVGSALLVMYGKYGSIADLQYVFDGLPQANVVSWNMMLAGYAQQGHGGKVLQLYDQMREQGVTPDNWTFVSALQACGMLAEETNEQWTRIESLAMGKVIHADAQRKGYGFDIFVANTLISMYSRCGSILDAEGMFDGLSPRTVVSWNAMFTAYVEQGEGEKALQLYRQMQEDIFVSPNEVTLVCILQSCAQTGSLDICRQIHQTLVGAGDILNPLLAHTLIHAYGRCGSMVDAQAVFDALDKPNVVSWTTLIAGYARQGNWAASLQRYELMQLAGVKPNGVTFLSLLSACSHAGLVHQGVEYFESMSRDYGITPGIEHYVSMVDLLGRAGYMERVEQLWLTLPMQPNLSLCLSLLSACRMHRNIALVQRAFHHAIQLQPTYAGTYILMGKVCADAGLWEQAKEVENLQHEAGAWKNPAQSWIEHKQGIHTFVVDDSKHPPQEHRQLLDLLGIVSLEPYETS